MNVKRTQTFFNKLDIYKCSGGEACLDQKLCSGFHVRCKCLEEFEIPIQEVAFFKDQREKIKRDGGKMTMEGKDIINARKVKKEQDDYQLLVNDDRKHASALKVDKVVREIKRRDCRLVWMRIQ